MLKLLRLRKYILFFRARRWAAFFSSQAPGSPFTNTIKAACPGLLLFLPDFCWVNVYQFGKWQLGASHRKQWQQSLRNAGGKDSWEFHGPIALFFDSSCLDKGRRVLNILEALSLASGLGLANHP